MPAGPPGARRTRGQALRLLLGLVLLLPPTDCARHRVAPPTAEAPAARAPDLSGRGVMVLPAQPSSATPQAVTAAFDAEAAYWLAERAPGVHWLSAAELDRVIARAPGLGIDIHALDARGFASMRLTRIGDPLFGDLRRLGAITGARFALLPASVTYTAARRFEAAVALIDSESGYVLWFGVVAGEPGPIDSPAAVATTAQALARALVPRD
jgi:hypothetical protein